MAQWYTEVSSLAMHSTPGSVRCGGALALVYALALAACQAGSQADTDASTEPGVDAAALAPDRGGDDRAVSVGTAIPFQENRGQWDPRVAFKADVVGGAVWVTTDGDLVHALSGWTLVEHLAGGTPTEPRALDRAATNVSYFLGADPARWASHVATTTRVSLGERWPGVEVELQAHGAAVEKLFHVAPGADLASIAIDLDGALATRVAPTGEVIATTGEGEISLSAPVAYQEVAGVRSPVAARYVLTSGGYAFAVGAHDPARELIIDPIVQSTYVGGAGSEVAGPILRDATGVLLGGSTPSANFPATAGVQPVHAMDFGRFDMVVARLSPDLTTYVQATYLGGTSDDFLAAMTVDATGNLLILGDSASNDFPATAGGAQPVRSGGTDLTVTRLDPTLTSLLQTTYLGGPMTETAGGIATNGAGEVVVAASVDSGFPGTAGGAQPSPAGLADIVVARLDAGLTTLLQATYLGGTGSDRFDALLVEPTGSVLIAGNTNSAGFPHVAGGAQTALGSSLDAFVSRLDGTLTTVVQSTYLGGNSDERVAALRLDGNGALLVGGTTRSTNFPATAGSAQSSNGGGGELDMVVVAMPASLSSVTRTTYLGGSAEDALNDLIVEPDGNLVVLGTSRGSFPGTAGGLAPAHGGGFHDMVVARIQGSLAGVGQATYVGCGGEDLGRALIRDPSGDLLITGSTTSTRFPGRVGGAQPALSGAQDLVVSRLSASLLAPPAPAAPAITSPVAGTLTNNTSPLVSGTCIAGFIVKLWVNGFPRCTATCQANGTFSCQAINVGGNVTFTATQADDAFCQAIVSPASPPVAITIDSIPPGAPTITSPAADSTISDNTPTITGSCDSGTTINVREGGDLLCASPCNAALYACTSAAMVNGMHTISATSTDPAGNVSAPASRTFTVNAPPPPGFTVPAAGGLINDNTPTFAGSCVSGLTVTIVEGATTLCSAPCASSAFACSSIMVADGPHTVQGIQSNAGGDISVPATRSFTVDSLAPAALTITAPVEGSFISASQPLIRGTGCEPGAAVLVREGATTLCTSACGAGNWSCMSWVPLDAGAHAVTAIETDPAGNPSPPVVRNFTVDFMPPFAPLITTPAAGSAVNDSTPDVGGSCETGATVTVREGVLTTLCTATCSASAFTCTTSPLAAGAHTVSAIQVDLAGNSSSTSPGRMFTVDLTAPAPPVITAPAADTSTADTTPAIGGTCENAATVTVREGAVTLCNATCAAAAFSCTSGALAEGAHTITAGQTDQAGNPSGDSPAVTFTVDTIAPADAPTITAPVAGSATNRRTPTVRGSCETDDTVTVREGAFALCTATCVAAAFACVTIQLNDGPHTIAAVQGDRAGNLGPPSASRTFTVDSQAPAAPAITAPADGTRGSEARPPIHGTCEAGAAVTVSTGDATVVCADVACATGAFGCTPAAALPVGTTVLSAVQVDGAANASPPSPAVHYTVEAPVDPDPQPADDGGGCCAIGGRDPIAPMVPAVLALAALLRRRRPRGGRPG